MDVTFPMALIATGHYTPKLCVRHGEPAAELWPVCGGTIPDWPFCHRCMELRRTLRAVAVAVVVVPLIAMPTGIVLSAEGVIPESVAEAAVFALMVGFLACWVLLTRTSPSRLARVMMTDSQMWLVAQGAHPAFAAHMDGLLQAAQREMPTMPARPPVFPTDEANVGLI